MIGPDVYVSGSYVEHFQPEGRRNPFRDLYAAKRRKVVAEIERQVPTGGSVLDLGGGPGRMAVPLAARYRVTLADLSEDMLRIAGADAAAAGTAANLALTQLDAGSPLPFADGAFDAALCVDLLVHLPAPHAALSELHRVLKPGGLLVADVSNREPWWILRYPRALGRRPRQWASAWRAGGVRPEWQGLVRHYRLGEFRAMLRQAGFACEREWHYGPAWCPKWFLAVCRPSG